MPGPILHTGAALAAHRLAKKEFEVPSAVLFVIAANLPDLDLIPGAFSGDLMRFHHGPAHSLLAACFFACGFALFAKARGWRVSPAAASQAWLPYFLVVCLSHPLMDLLTYDLRGGRLGLELLWPLSARAWGPVADVLPGLIVSQSWRTWLCLQNLEIALLELTLAAALVAAARVLGPKVAVATASETRDLSSYAAN